MTLVLLDGLVPVLSMIKKKRNMQEGNNRDLQH